MTDNIILQPLTPTDEEVLWPFLALAAHEPRVQTVRENPALALYAAGWGRAGDSGFAAVAGEGATAIGAVWLRLWMGGERGFAYVDERTPELAMAVVPEYRGFGIGTRLLERILDEARETCPAVSLSVRADSPVVRLYERFGFQPIKGSEIVNRTGGVSFNMILRW